MVSCPKEIRTHCKHCKMHQNHKVTQYKTGAASLLAQGKRRYDRKQQGQSTSVNLKPDSRFLCCLSFCLLCMSLTVPALQSIIDGVAAQDSEGRRSPCSTRRPRLQRRFLCA